MMIYVFSNMHPSPTVSLLAELTFMFSQTLCSRQSSLILSWSSLFSQPLLIAQFQSHVHICMLGTVASKFRVPKSVLVSHWRCNKLPQLSGSDQLNFTIFQFCSSEIWHRSYQTKVKVSSGLYSFWRHQRKISLFKKFVKIYWIWHLRNNTWDTAGNSIILCYLCTKPTTLLN